MKAWGVVTDQGRAVSLDVLDRYAVKESEGSTQIRAEPKFQGARGIVKPRYDPTQLAALLEQNTAHLVACRQKAEDILGRGWDFVQVSDDATDEGRRRLEAWFEDVPAPDTALSSYSHRDVLINAQFDFESMGRGAIELARQDSEPNGPVEAVFHVPANTIRVHRDGVRFLQSRHGKRRWFKWAGAPYDVDRESGAKHQLGSLRPERRAHEIVWWTNYSPLDTVYGAPDIIPAIGAVLGDLSRRDYNLEFFSNFGIPSYAVFVTGDFDPGEFVNKDGEKVDESDPTGKTEIEWHLQAMLKEVRENPHSSLVWTIPTREDAEDGEVNIEFKPLATDVKEASFRLYRKDNREEVLSSHRMSAAIAGVYDAGQANREARSQYKQSVIWTRRATLELVVNHFIVATLDASGWRAKLRPLDTREDQVEFDLMHELVEAGAATPKELRERFGPRLGLDPQAMPEHPDTDVAAVGIPSLLEQQVIQLNEARIMLGLTPVDGGDRFITPAEELEAELRRMRDDLATMALKARGSDNGMSSADLGELVHALNGSG